jgi:hypothetical protein
MPLGCRYNPVMLRTLTAAVLLLAAPLVAAEKPLMKDFIGLNTHTVQHKPDLYKPIADYLRDYHGIVWDLEKESDYKPTFPMSRNKVDWKNDVYGKWRAVGADVNVSLMFEQIPAKDWKDLPKDAHAYGKAFAGYFGPSHENLVQSMEIGNEPGKFAKREVLDQTYRQIFEAMATGLREGDPKLKIVTANLTIHKSDDYSINIDSIKGLEKLYDVINTHTYAQAEPYPTWKRSYPEDTKLKYLTDVQGLIDWRNKNAKGKPVWITEFGYDSTTKPNDKTGTFKDWVGNTDTEQAQWIVRSWLVFSAMDVERAYLYWFNDGDKPSVHAASGLTRSKPKPADNGAKKKSPSEEEWPEYQPKPSYWASKHLRATLGDYRFSKQLVNKPGELYVFEYVHGKTPGDRILVAWSPTREGKSTMQAFPVGGKIQKIERMPLADGPAEKVDGEVMKNNVHLPIDGSPVYIWVK